MAINHFKTSKALLDRLKSLSGLPPLAQENSAYTPTVGQAYMREVDMSGATQAPTLNADGFQRQDGLYRVGVFVPKNNGKFNAIGYIDAIIAGFPRGLVLTHEGQKVRIEQSGREQGFVDGEFYQAGVMIRYTVVA